jgi:hypothetical protein
MRCCFLPPSRSSTVTALRNVIYFPAYQHAQPIAVLAT